MPPKKAPEPSKKTELKKKEKVIEDKTFGLKNKKGAKTQKFIQHVTHQVKFGNQSAAKIAQQQLEKQKGAKSKEDELAELNKLFKPVAEMPKLGKDVDPKSVLCVFFKQGMCSKGEKCKFSHDLEIERKAEKRSAYVDMRDANDEDNMDNWDDDKLKEVVEKKHGESNKAKPKTEIVCKHFLQALEDSKYGWFWECPSGGDKCIYRHCLPPGYVLKKDRVKFDQQNKGDEISLEELVEKERAALGADLPKVTLESFLAWKQRKRRQQADKRSQDERRKRAEYKQGKQTGLSGRELFTFNPDLIAQDDEEADDERYSVHSSDEEEGTEEGAEKRTKIIAKDIDISMFLNGLDLETTNGNYDDDEANKMDFAGAGTSAAKAFDEDLFAGDENLDDIDDEDASDEEDDRSQSD